MVERVRRTEVRGGGHSLLLAIRFKMRFGSLWYFITLPEMVVEVIRFTSYNLGTIAAQSQHNACIRECVRIWPFELPFKRQY